MLSGLEDLNDHDEFRKNPVAGAVLGCLEAKRKDCEALAGKSTLNRLELSAASKDAKKARKFVAVFVLSALGIATVAVVMGRRIAKPMRGLAAAGRLGRGEAVDDLYEAGPAETRETVRAFNLMRGRLDRYVRDRTAMLAAVSHDLRTPITSLRLHAEFVENGETRARILAALDEMQRMTEDALAFIREDMQREETRMVDLHVSSNDRSGDSDPWKVMYSALARGNSDNLAVLRAGTHIERNDTRERATAGAKGWDAPAPLIGRRMVGPVEGWQGLCWILASVLPPPLWARDEGNPGLPWDRGNSRPRK